MSQWNVAEHLTRMARDFPDQPAMFLPPRRAPAQGTIPHEAITFAELNRHADALAHGLTHLGITAGMRAVLMVPPGREFFALTFALLKAGMIPVLIDPGMGIKNLGTCLAEAEPQAFLGIAKAHLARRILGWGKRTIQFTVNVGRSRFWCSTSTHKLRELGMQNGPFSPRDVGPDDPSAILFTSGSTGIAKGAEYTHGIFTAQVQMLQQIYGINPGEIDFCTFPLFALFGPALGMTSVVPLMNAAKPASIDPHVALRQLQQFPITNLFGSPAVIRKLATLADSGVTSLKTVRRVISAGAPATPLVLERFRKLLPAGTQVFTPYGATESLPVANIGSDEILQDTRAKTDEGHGVCIGKPVPGVRVEIIPIRDERIETWDESLALPAGAIGEIVVNSPCTTQQYFHRPEATRLAKIYDSATGRHWHRMGDLGYRDDLGRLWFCGRKSHRVALPGQLLLTDQVEPFFNIIPGVFRTALVGVIRNGQTYPMLWVELDQTRRWPEVLRDLQHRAEADPRFAVIRAFLPHRCFPVDVRHNSKIFREKLSILADRKLPAAWHGEAL